MALWRMEAFLSSAAPRVRVLGGTRFDGAGAHAPEWAAFGSYCFLLPRLELLEAAGCCLLSCTLAWRESVGPSERRACKSHLLCSSILLVYSAQPIEADDEMGPKRCGLPKSNSSCNEGVGSSNQQQIHRYLLSRD